jgi:hypothetical protein
MATRLSGDLVGGGLVVSFEISADSSRVVYRADQQTDDVDELYSVPLGGGTATKLNGTLVSSGDVHQFEISPDSSQVVYRADQVTDNVQELFRVPLGGGTATRLSRDLDGGVWDKFEISSDSSRVVYMSGQENNDVHDLYSSPLARLPRIKLNGTLVSDGSVRVRNQSRRQPGGLPG